MGVPTQEHGFKKCGMGRFKPKPHTAEGHKLGYALNLIGQELATHKPNLVLAHGKFGVNKGLFIVIIGRRHVPRLGHGERRRKKS